MAHRILNTTGIVLLSVFVATLLPLTIPKLFGYGIYNVLSGSMEPEIPVHSIIYVKKCIPGELEPGDIITFRLGSGMDLTETHRVVSIDASDETIATKGDANKNFDQTRVGFASVVGRVVLSIPMLGKVSGAINSEYGTGMCVMLLALPTLMFVAADKLEPKEERK